MPWLDRCIQTRTVASQQLRTTPPMPLYEKRTYQVTTGEMPNVIKLYQDIAWPVMQAKASPKTSSAISSPTPARSTN